MDIQSISVVIPTKMCVNNCPFCVSKMHDNEHKYSSFDKMKILKRLKYAENNGVNNLILTGTGEALQNKKFLELLLGFLNEKEVFFPNIELQTTGVFLNVFREVFAPMEISKYLLHEIIKKYDNLELLKGIGVNTISLSVSNIFDDERNMDLIGAPKHLRFILNDMISLLHENGFNVRLSLNMTNDYDIYLEDPLKIIERCSELGADQITLRRLYDGGTNGHEDKWVRSNRANDDLLNSLNHHIMEMGEMLYKLPYGAGVYSINGMSTVIDDDCMGKSNNDSLKYLILREDGKLYCRWDDRGSLIF